MHFLLFLWLEVTNLHFEWYLLTCIVVVQEMAHLYSAFIVNICFHYFFLLVLQFCSLYQGSLFWLINLKGLPLGGFLSSFLGFTVADDCRKPFLTLYLSSKLIAGTPLLLFCRRPRVPSTI